MSVIRVGSNGTYAEGWDQIFGGTSRKKAAGKPGKAAGKKAAVKTAKRSVKPAGKAKKTAGKKKAAKRR